jgi:cytochrome P450
VDRVYDPSSSATQADPYPFYDVLRELGTHWRPDLEAWIVPGYEAALSVLRGASWSAHQRNGQITGGRAANPVLMFMDPPDHTRLRSAVNRAFTARSVERLRRHIERLVDQLLAPAYAAGGLEVMSELANILPVSVIAGFLGVPETDQDMFHEFAQPLAPVLDWRPTPQALSQAADSMLGLIPYFTRLIRERRRDPQDDFVSALATSDTTLTIREVVTTAVLLFVAASMSTLNLIGNGLWAFLCHPYQADLLRKDPDLVRPAIEECLRYDSPVQVLPRSALEATSVEGMSIPAGAQALVLIGSANRDGSEFVQSDAFLIERESNPHLSFGQGVHYCIGAALGRLEAEVVFRRLIVEGPPMSLDHEPTRWLRSKTQRGLLDLRVRFG